MNCVLDRKFCLILSSFFIFVSALLFPATAFAQEVSQSVNSTMTIEMQTNSASTSAVVSAAESDSEALTQTGDIFVWLVLALVVLAVGFAYVALKARSFSVVGVHVNISDQQKEKLKLIAVGVATVVLAATFMCIFATKSFAEESEISSNISAESYILVDESGDVISSEITLTSERSDSAKIDSVNAPSGFEGWSSDLDGKTIEAGEELAGEWSGESIPDDILEKLEDNDGKLELSYSVSVSFDVTYNIGDVDVVADTGNQVYSASQKTPSVAINGLVKGEDYDVVYGENTSAGESSGTITIKGIGFWTGEQTIKFDILKKPITANVTASAKDKTYDATTDVEITNISATFDTLSGSDSLAIKSYSAKFADKNVADKKSVVISDVVFDGSALSNYEITKITQSECSAAITAKTVTVSGVSGKERAYKEDDKSVSLDGTATFASGDIISGDNVSIASVVAGDYADADAEDDKEIQLSITLGGTDKDNYVVSDASKKTKGNILAIVKFETNCTAATAIADKNPHINAKITDDVTASLPARAGLKVEGWYTDEACSGISWDFATSTVTENETTLYARWTQEEEADLAYWMAPSIKVTTGNTSSTANQTNPNYVSETWNILKTPDEIQADVAKIKEGDSDVISEYTDFMTKDNYHLYTRYGSGDGTNKNDYAEFRIIQVGQHFNVDGDETSADGSVLTFMATHELPTAYVASGGATQGGWGTSSLRSNMSSGEIFKSFQTGFTNDVVNVQKKYNSGYGASATSTPLTSSDKLWTISYSELFATGTYSGSLPQGEGTAYSWCTNNSISGSGNNPCLSFKTRVGGIPGSCDATTSSYNYAWWLRSPFATSTFKMTLVNNNGAIGGEMTAWLRLGIVPCFAFGTQRTVSFDNQGHGNTLTAQNIEIGSTAVQPTDAEVGSEDGFTLEGWYTDPKCTSATKWDFSSDTVSEDTTLYANWVVNTQESPYWMAPASGTSNYVSETQGAIKTASQIKSDIEKLKSGDTTVTSEYTKYMTDENYHLYTTYGSGDGTSKDDYVEFRIIEVGAHQYDAKEGNSDNSSLTFMATHLLPSAEKMKASHDNAGGWGNSLLRDSMQSGGTIYSNFNSGFTDDILSINKAYHTGTASKTIAISSDKLWIPSYSEMYKTGEYASIVCPGSATSPAEGKVYTWFSNKNINGDNNNACLSYTTRSGAAPQGATKGNGAWWERSANILWSPNFIGVSAKGTPSYTNNAGYFYGAESYGVVPCFAL